jgi:hypothetical protein
LLGLKLEQASPLRRCLQAASEAKVCSRLRKACSHWNPSEFSLVRGRGRFSPPSSDMYIGLWRKAPISSTNTRTLHRGFGFLVIRETATLGTPSHLACLKSWTGRHCPTFWTDVPCRFFSRLHSTPWRRTNSNSWRVSSSRLGLKSYRDSARSPLTCGSTYKQKLVRGSVPSWREG